MSLQTFKQKFTGDLLIRSQCSPDEYAKAIARWATNAQKNAGIVAYVRNAADVSEAIKYAKVEKLEVAIHCGGHHASGASSTEGGLVIDLSRYLKEVRVDAKKQYAYVGGGTLLGAIDVAAIEHGLAPVVGIVNHTGIGGLLLGGGYGFQTPAHGLTIDNLVEATVVIADGSILTASKDENPDLFWAIRGSGSNFGVVTEFVLQLHPQDPTVFAGVLVYTPDRVKAVANAIDAWWNGNPTAKEVVYQIITTAPDGSGHPVIGVLLFYNGTEAEGRKIFKPFLDLEPLKDMCAEIPYEKLNSLNNHMVPHGLNRYHKSIFYSGSQKEVTPDLYQRWLELNKNSSVSYAVFHEYFVGGEVTKVPRDATAFFQREKTCHALCFATWTEPSPENFATAKAGATELLKYSAVAEGVPVEDGYGNYTSDVEGSAASAHFGGNYPRLQELKRKYDPEMFFNKWFAISPA